MVGSKQWSKHCVECYINKRECQGLEKKAPASIRKINPGKRITASLMGKHKEAGTADFNNGK